MSCVNLLSRTEVIDSNNPNDHAEVKIGLEAELAKNWNLCGHAGYQQGSHAYQQTEGNIGIKYLIAVCKKTWVRDVIAPRLNLK